MLLYRSPGYPQGLFEVDNKEVSLGQQNSGSKTGIDDEWEEDFNAMPDGGPTLSSKKFSGSSKASAKSGKSNFPRLTAA